MATQVSPGVRITEIDQTLALTQTAQTEGALAGYFPWGPTDIIRTVISEDDLVKKFGKPDAASADAFFTGANFLAYSSALRVVRVVNDDQARNATAASGGDVIAGSTFTVNTTAAVLTAATGNTADLFAGLTLSVSNSTAGPVAVTVSSITNATSAILTGIPATAVTGGNATSYGQLIKNEDQYESVFADGSASKGTWAAKYAGALGNSLKVEVCHSANAYTSVPAFTLTAGAGNTTVVASNTISAVLSVGDLVVANTQTRQVASLINSTAFTVNTAFTTALSAATFTRKWQYFSLFTSAPGTSPFARTRGGASDEMHVVVVDAGGAFSGVANTVLERYAFVSKASDAKTETGATNYYKDVLNRRSAYVWWLDHASDGTDYGSAVSGVTFGAPVLVESNRLTGGVSGAAPSDADIMLGYDKFLDETVDISFILGAAATTTVATHLISLAEAKRYAIAFLSPERADVVDNAGDEVDDIIEFRNTLPSSSYAVLDSGWKYQYDKYNDTYRYVPLNGDTAGTCVRTDQISEAWFSPAGFSRGQIKNVYKLPFSPNQAQRDDLYRSGINPVAAFPGQGYVLYGDKTLLDRPSMFDRINVRRLFIVMEKTVEKSAKAVLFEQNDEFTRQNFVNVVEPYLRSVKGRRGITDYFVQCDSTNNPPDAIGRNEFRADIYVKPITSVNFISVNFTAVRGDVQFSEVITNLS